jgi:pimeloyl-ACP methyl ester carboxylesterase
MSYDSPIDPRRAALPAGTLELGSGEPLILLHGIMGSPAMWRETLAPLAQTQRVIALAALGHQGGRPCTQRPCRIEHMVDDAERSLDALGLARAHLAGNSMGGWMALELARRGRARSVCALSPAGMWDTTDHFAGANKLRATQKLTRMTRGGLPWSSKLGAIRRFALRDTAEHGERVSPATLVELADALLACQVGEDLLSTPEKFLPLKATCPIDIVWSRPDRIFPMQPFAENARERAPDARHLVLDHVGHVPMLDNPRLVAQTILATIARTSEQAAASRRMDE